MLRGLWKLTWLEIKIFLREPLGALGTIGIPVLVFVVLGRVAGRGLAPRSAPPAGFVRVGLPVFAAVLIAISAVLSLVTIISIYREGGILKRLRATPLRPQTILTAHVLVKLLLTAVTLALMLLAGKRYYPVNVDVPVLGFTIALLISTWSILSIGFRHRQHRAHGALRAADRRGHPVSDDRPLGTVLPGRGAAARAAGGGAGAAAHLRGVAAPGDLEGRRVVGAHGRRRGAGRGVRRVHGALGEGVSVGVKKERRGAVLVTGTPIGCASLARLDHQRLRQLDRYTAATRHASIHLCVRCADCRSRRRSAGRSDNRGFCPMAKDLPEHGTDRRALDGVSDGIRFAAHLLHLRVTHFRYHGVCLAVECD